MQGRVSTGGNERYECIGNITEEDDSAGTCDKPFILNCASICTAIVQVLMISPASMSEYSDSLVYAHHSGWELRSIQLVTRRLDELNMRWTYKYALDRL